MALRFFQKTETISFADGQGEVSVRGLTLAEITELVDTHKDDAIKLFDKFTGRDPESLTINDAATVASDLIVKFPMLVAHIVAIGADAKDRFDDIVRLPPDVLIRAVEAVAVLTFAMSGGFNSFLEMVLRIAAGTNRAVAEVKSLRPSSNGSKASGGK